MISKSCFWMMFNQYSRVEGNRGAGTQENWGQKRAGSRSRNKKGTRLLFFYCLSSFNVDVA